MGTNDDTSKDRLSSAASAAKPKPAFSGSDRDTLLLIIHTHISPGTRVMSDMLKAYDCLKGEGYTHLTVNYSLNSVAPTQVRTPSAVKIHGGDSNEVCLVQERPKISSKAIYRNGCVISSMETILLPRHYQAYRRLYA